MKAGRETDGMIFEEFLRTKIKGGWGQGAREQRKDCGTQQKVLANINIMPILGFSQSIR